jgi:uncharacterized membrane protein YhaH (DUF805 family)
MSRFRWRQLVSPTGRAGRLAFGQGLGLIGFANLVGIVIGTLADPVLPEPASTIAAIALLTLPWLWSGGCLFAQRLRDAGVWPWLAVLPPLALAVGVSDMVAQVAGLKPTDHELGMVVAHFGSILLYGVALIAIWTLPEPLTD